MHRLGPKQAVVDARKKRALHSELGFSGLVARYWVGIDFTRIFALSSYVLCNPFMPSRIRIDFARAEVNNTETSSSSITTSQYLSLGTTSSLLRTNAYAS